MKRLFGIFVFAAMLMGLVSCEKPGALVPDENVAPVTLKQSIYYSIDVQDSEYVYVLAFGDRNEAYYWDGNIEDMGRLSMSMNSDEAELPEEILKGTYTYDFNTASGSVDFSTGTGTFVINKDILTFSFGGNIFEMNSVEAVGYPFHHHGQDPPMGGDEY